MTAFSARRLTGWATFTGREEPDCNISSHPSPCCRACNRCRTAALADRNRFAKAHSAWRPMISF